jgi:ubiquinone/menaquinone biosynthesis C-methylase UbiE
MIDQPAADPYDLIAALYDLEHHDVTEDLGLYRQYAYQRGGPILEVGCGSGRVLVPLAQAGYAVTGIDRSPAMLQRCRQALDAVGLDVAERVTLVQSDMPQLALDRRDFVLAIVALGTFQSFVAPEDRLQALRALREHVTRGATLIIDLDQEAPRLCAALSENGQIRHLGTWLDEQTHQVLTHTIAARTGELPPALIVTHWYDMHEQHGPVSRVWIETGLVPIAPSELSLALDATGWRLRQTFGDYDQGSYDAASPRLIAVAEAL